HPLVLYAAPRGTTTGPDFPAAALWMCAAEAWSIFATLANDQQTVPFAPSRWRTTRPEPAGEAFGTSFDPSSLAETTGLIPACADELASATAGTASAARAATSNERERMGILLDDGFTARIAAHRRLHVH